MIKNLIKKDNIQIIENNITQLDFFKMIGDLLEKDGYVTKDFSQQLSMREISYPTGLRLGKCCVAIPHVEGQYSQKSTIFISLLKHTINWRNMEDIDEILPVSIVFNLVLTTQEKHITILQELIKMIQNENLIEKINNADTAEQIYQIIEKEEI